MKRIISIIIVMAMILSMLGVSAYAAAPTPEPTGDVGILANVRVKFVNNTKYGGIDRREGAYVQSYLPEDELIYEGSVTNVTDEVFYIKSMGFYLVEDRFASIDKSKIPTDSINIPVEPHSTYKVEVPVKVAAALCINLDKLWKMNTMTEDSCRQQGCKVLTFIRKLYVKKYCQLELDRDKRRKTLDTIRIKVV